MTSEFLNLLLLYREVKFGKILGSLDMALSLKKALVVTVQILHRSEKQMFDSIDIKY